MFKKIAHPILFQGHLKRKNYFEGWYYKQVCQETQQTIAFIPGISLNQADPHAFVQVIVSHPVQTYYFDYPIESFSYQEEPFQVKIGPNVFTEDKVILQLYHGSDFFEGELNLTRRCPIKSSLLMPNIMGFFAYIPRMACNHGVISMHHQVNGSLQTSVGSMAFKHDTGYIEKDWGTSFPDKYIWLQANHFGNNQDSLMTSIATIPFAVTTFMGHLANLHVEGHEYRFATYNGSKIAYTQTTPKKVHLALQRKNLTLEIIGELTDAGDLKAPQSGRMIHTIKEGLGGRLSYSLSQDKQVLHEGSSDYAGIEIVNW